MKTKIFYPILSIVLTVMVTGNLFAQTTVFVKSGASGTGTSWANAYGSLTSALSASGSGQLSIYIAAGTYNAAYTIPASRNVYIKGGYPTSATGQDTSSYNPTTNVVNIGQSSSSGSAFSYGGASGKQFSLIGIKLTGSSTTFSAPVFTMSGSITNSTLLFKDLVIVNNSTNGRSGDGLFSFKSALTGSTVDFENSVFGTASGTSTSNSGTAIYWDGASTSTTNFIFNNSALNYETTQSGDLSAGLYLVGTPGATFSITNSGFCGNNNSAGNDEGTSIYINGAGTFTINNDYFSNNTNNANYAGSAINIDAFSGTANITNSGFTSNTATKSGSAYGGGAVYIGGSTGVHFLNDIFFGNTSGSYGGAMFARNGSTFDIKNSYFYNNTATSGGGAIDLYNSTSAALDGVYFAGNKIGASPTTLGADLYYNSTSGNFTSIASSFLQLSSAASYTTASHFVFGSGNTFNYSTVGSSSSGSCKTALSLNTTISGNVYNDANGLTDNTVNGAGTNAGNTLYAALYDNTTGKVAAYATVASTGTYSVNVTPGDSYTAYLTSTAPTVGQTAVPTVTLPSGWKNTGENLGSGTGSDGTVDSKLSIGTVSAATSNANFGIVQCPNGLTITASASQALVCSSQTTAITLNSTASGGITPYAGYLWAGSGLTASNTQNTTAKPTATGNYSVTVTDAVGCTATGTTGTVTYNNPTPSIITSCNGTAIQLADANNINAATWTWTTTSGGRFYKDNTYDVTTDSATSHLPGPYIITKGSYTLVVVDGNGCTGTDTKALTGTICSTVLASNVPGVTAQRHGTNVQLQWVVTNESTVQNYTIERSIDGSVFTTTGILHAANTGSHTYSFTNDVSAIGCIKLYYRIKQTNADGISYYSNIIPVNCNANDVNEYVLKVYPNPVQTGNKLTVSYSLPAAVSKAQLVITNTLGGVYNTTTVSNAGTVATTAVDIQNMPAGVYFVRLVSDKWVGKTIKIIKAN